MATVTKGSRNKRVDSMQEKFIYPIFAFPYIKERCKTNRETGCWEWQEKSVDRSGYGLIKHRWFGEKFMYVHRIMYEIKNGHIPEDMIVLHSCDNPRCCNPEHLSVGTHYMNTLDMLMKDRQHSKLSRIDVIRMKRYLVAKRYTHKELAEKYGVSVGTIRGIAQGKTWKHVPFPHQLDSPEQSVEE